MHAARTVTTSDVPTRGTAVTSNRRQAVLNEPTVSSVPRWPWWLVARSPRQVLIVSVAPVVMPVLVLVNPTNTPYPSWLHWVALLMIVYLAGCAVASVVGLSRDPELRNASRQRRPVGRSTRHLYAVATLSGVAVVLLALVVALVVQTAFAWLALSVASVLTLMCFGQLGRPLVGVKPTASTSDSK